MLTVLLIPISRLIIGGEGTGVLVVLVGGLSCRPFTRVGLLLDHLNRCIGVNSGDGSIVTLLGSGTVSKPTDRLIVGTVRVFRDFQRALAEKMHIIVVGMLSETEDLFQGS